MVRHSISHYLIRSFKLYCWVDGMLKLLESGMQAIRTASMLPTLPNLPYHVQFWILGWLPHHCPWHVPKNSRTVRRKFVVFKILNDHTIEFTMSTESGL